MISNTGLHRYAKTVAAFTFLLLIAGGLVTSTGSGLAVPDWPLSFGKFFPRMTGGVLFEHGHRMVAGVDIGLTAILIFWVFRARVSSAVRRLALAAGGAILLQACLGGATVLLRLPPAVSVAHAGLAQAFFCMVVVLSAITSARWESLRAEFPDSGFPSISFLAWAATFCIYGQILIGALMRHIGAGLSIPDFPLSFGKWVPGPGEWSVPVAINYAHRVGACVVTLLILWTSLRIFLFKGEIPALRGLARVLLLALVLQVTLGAVTVWSGRAVIPATVHVATGAFLLAASLLTAVCAGRAFTHTHFQFFTEPSAAGSGS